MVAPAAVKTVSSPVATVRSLSSPLPGPKAISPIDTVTGARINTFGTLTPRDCVTEGGCLVKTLLGAGLAKRSADAESDPQYIAASPAALPFALSPYAGAYYNRASLPYTTPYAAAAYTTPYAAAYTTPYAAAYNTPYATYANYAPLAAPAVVAAEPAVVAAEPAVVAAEPVVEVAPVPTPVVNALPAVAPVAPVAPLVRAAVPVPTPVVAPVVRQAYKVPIVENVGRKVEYVHLGAHPIKPTTVYETDSRVVGEQIVF